MSKKALSQFPVTDDANVNYTPENDVWDGQYEFGGTLGNLGLICYSHFIVYYMWICIEFYAGEAVYPGAEALNGESFFTAIVGIIRAHACPSMKTVTAYLGLILFNWMCAVFLPGVIGSGVPIPSEGGARRLYLCNGLFSWYAFLIVVGCLHFYDILPVYYVRQHFGQFLTTAVIIADLWALVLYVGSCLGNCWLYRSAPQVRVSGNPLHDFFMGATLNPRLPSLWSPRVDLKMFAEIRMSWLLFWVNTASCAAEMYRSQGFLSGNMMILLLINGAYTNACQKGEECIITTWDINHEKYGWMLMFWNFVGVPFLYCAQPLYLQTVRPNLEYPTPVLWTMVVFFLVVYWVFDTCNSQKNKFRMQRIGVDEKILRRKAFPFLPYGFIPQPKTLKGPGGKELFLDGWLQFSRKPHYVADVCIALCWTTVCGFQHFFVPYFFLIFFCSMLLHRTSRDEQKCRKKYGPMWDEYCRLVPYKYIPYVY